MASGSSRWTISMRPWRGRPKPRKRAVSGRGSALPGKPGGLSPPADAGDSVQCRSSLPAGVRPRRFGARPGVRGHRSRRGGRPGGLCRRRRAVGRRRPSSRAQRAGSLRRRRRRSSIACDAKPLVTTATRSPRSCTNATEPDVDQDLAVQDDRLRLIFSCCHPALGPPARSR